jgi:hypothetical protein
MSPEFPVTGSARRLAGLCAVALLWQGCGGGDLTTPDQGVIGVTATTSGPEPDPDGYTIQLDEADPVSLPAGVPTYFSTEAGSHTLELGGLSSNCAVQGGDGSRRSVQVSEGDTSLVTFDVFCDATSGALTVTTATAGASLDADGYAVAVDGGEEQVIEANGTLTITGLTAGDHTVTLSGIAANCTASGDNPRPATVTAGTTTLVAFELACTGPVARWTRVDAGTRADLTSVWSTSPADVFIVGEVETNRGAGLASVIRHYDGARWVEQHREADLRLRGLWGSTPTDVYAVGFDFFTPIGRMLHYDGAEWTEVPGFTSVAEELSLESVWGTSERDVFAVGGAFDGFSDQALIYHFTGGVWQRMPVTGSLSPSLTDVWGSSPTDVYAVGRSMEPPAGVVLHYDGATWTPALQHEGLVPNAVWGSSSTDVFLVGFQVDQDEDGQFIVTTAVWHYDGTTWSAQSVPAEDTVLDDVWGSSAADVYAVGENGLILHYDGTGWSATNQTDDTLLGIFGSSLSDVYAVGNGGRVLHGTP